MSTGLDRSPRSILLAASASSFSGRIMLLRKRFVNSRHSRIIGMNVSRHVKRNAGITGGWPLIGTPSDSVIAMAERSPSSTPSTVAGPTSRAEADSLQSTPDMLL